MIASQLHDSLEDVKWLTQEVLLQDITTILIGYGTYHWALDKAKQSVDIVKELTHNYDYYNMSENALRIKLCDRIDNITDCIYYPTTPKLRYKYSQHGGDTPKLIGAASEKIGGNQAIDVLANIMEALG